MRVRIVKISDKHFVLQTGNPSWGDGWNGLQVEYAFLGKVVGYETWMATHLQLKYCSFRSKDSAMKAIEKLRVYFESLRKTETTLADAEVILSGSTGVVYECEI